MDISFRAAFKYKQKGHIINKIFIVHPCSLLVEIIYIINHRRKVILVKFAYVQKSLYGHSTNRRRAMEWIKKPEKEPVEETARCHYMTPCKRDL